MSKTLIKHLWKTNRDQILRNSLVNCHAKGLNSIVLLDEPGKRIRLFVATDQHDLYRNFSDDPGPMSIAFHPHHCDIMIEVVRGSICNRLLKFNRLNDIGRPMDLTMYRYQSSLRGEMPGFEKLCSLRGYCYQNIALNERYPVYEMHASDIHTVAAYSIDRPAWLIYEGAEDPNYQPFCYSNADLTKWSADGMYLPMSSEQVEQTIDEVLV